MLAAPVHARYDDYQTYRQPQPTYQTKVDVDVPPPENKFIGWFKDLFQGAVQGDINQRPTMLNLAGHILTGFTPMAPVADARDFAVDSYRTAASGFKAHKQEAAWAAAGLAPMVSEIHGTARLIKMERQAVLAERAFKDAGYIHDMRLVRKVLPELRPEHAAEFEVLRTRIFKPGERIYRTPNMGEAEDALRPGRWFGTRNMITRNGAESMYKTARYGNTRELVRGYEFKQATTVYYGKVKGGTAWQVYIPDDINTGDILKLTGTRWLK